MNKKSGNFYKKHGRPASEAERKSWEPEFKKYQSKQAGRARADYERFFGKTSDKQWQKVEAERRSRLGIDPRKQDVEKTLGIKISDKDWGKNKRNQSKNFLKNIMRK